LACPYPLYVATIRVPYSGQDFELSGASTPHSPQVNGMEEYRLLGRSSRKVRRSTVDVGVDPSFRRTDTADRVHLMVPA
jgi:hypothetical protein